MSKISELPTLSEATGLETVVLVRDGVTRRSRLGPIAAAAVAPLVAQADGSAAIAAQHAVAAAAVNNQYPSFEAGIAASANGANFVVIDALGRWVNVYRKGVSPDADHPVIRLPGSVAYRGLGGAAMLGWAQAGATTEDSIQRKLEESVSLRDFGAIGGNVFRDTTALLDALSLASTASRQTGGAAINVFIPWLPGGALLLDPDAINEALAEISNGTFPINIVAANNGSPITPSAPCDHLFRLGGTLVTFEGVRVVDGAGRIRRAAWYGYAAPTDYPIALKYCRFEAGNASKAFLYENDGPYRYELTNPTGQNIGGLLNNTSAGVQGRILGGGYLSGGTYIGLNMDGAGSPHPAQAEGFRCEESLILIMNGAANTRGVKVKMALDAVINFDVNVMGPGGIGLEIDATEANKPVTLSKFRGFWEGGAGGRSALIRGNVSKIELDCSLGAGSSTNVSGIDASGVQGLRIRARQFFQDGVPLTLNDCIDVEVDGDLRGLKQPICNANVKGVWRAKGIPVVRYASMAYPDDWTNYTPGVTAGSGQLGAYRNDIAKWRRSGQTLYATGTTLILDNGTGDGTIDITMPIPLNAGDDGWGGREGGRTGLGLTGEAANVTISFRLTNNGYPGGTGAVLRWSGSAEIQPGY